MTALHRPAPHESGRRHTTGEARYIDDLPLPAGALVGRLVLSEVAKGTIVGRSDAEARALPGVVDVLWFEDIPGDPRIGPVVHDEPLLADGRVHCVGQPVAVVIAVDDESALRGALAVQVRIEAETPILTIAEAEAAGAFIGPTHTIVRGDVDAALASAATVIEAVTGNGAQEHFYLETQTALVFPEEGRVRVLSSTQHPTEVQRLVARTLGVGDHDVVCEVPRLGGGFGGKESQAAPIACLAAIAAVRHGVPVKLRLDRETDGRFTGKRHPFQARYRAGFDADGRIVAFDVDLIADAGWSQDLSLSIVDRALFHLDNACFLPNVRFVGRAARTNLPSNTAFRGFGGPQGMLVMEDALARYAERTGADPLAVHLAGAYDGPGRDVAPYGQVITDLRAVRVLTELAASADWAGRRAAVAAFNAAERPDPWVRRGIGIVPVKFGISFTASFLNQAGALVLWFADGTAQVNHGGTEMGQGLHTKMIAVAAHELGLKAEGVRVMTTSTDKVPNTSATAASSGSDLNGAAVADACHQLIERVRPVAAGILGCAADEVRFEEGQVTGGGRSVPVGEVTKAAWFQRVSLSASGFYRTPGIAYDRVAGHGTPFFYYAWGASISEVEVCGLTGMTRVLRADILHDVGASLVPTVDRGQVEGAYVQGLGWLTIEEVIYDERGRSRTAGPSTYKIPTSDDAPLDFRVALLANAAQDGVIGGSKAVGEPPFLHAVSALNAIRDAVASFGPAGREVELSAPATPEAVLRAIGRQRA